MALHHNVHSILFSIVHLPFEHACKEIGCTPMALDTFIKEMDPLLRASLPAFPDSKAEREKLYRAFLAGEVIAVERLEGETMCFLVRGAYGPSYIDLRLTYNKDAWTAERITSVHRRPFVRTKPFLGGVAAIAVLGAGLIGYVLPRHSSALTAAAVQSWANVNGYTLMPSTAVASNSLGNATTNATAAGAPSAANSAQSAAQPDKPKPTTLSFHFKGGMTVHDISKYLAQNHLVSNALAFDHTMKATGTDKKVRYGMYTFTSGMNEGQVLDVLKKGPNRG